MVDRTELFDEELLKILRAIKGVEVYDSFADNTDAPLYIITHTGAEVGASLEHDMPITGHQDDLYEHPFYIEIWGTDGANVRRLSSYIKDILIGAILINGSSGINVIPSAYSRDDFDASMRPAKYSRYLAFTVRLDRSSH